MLRQTPKNEVKPAPAPAAAPAPAPKPPTSASTNSSNQQAASVSASAPATAAAVQPAPASAAAPASNAAATVSAAAPPTAVAATKNKPSNTPRPQQPQQPQQPQLSEEAQTAKVLEDLRTSLQGKDFPAIIKQAFERIKDKTKPHGPQLKEMHEALLNIDLPSAYRILRMIKGRSKTATTGYTYTIQTRQQQTPVGPAKGLQKAMTGFTDSLRGTARSALGSALGLTGGARTRRNKQRRSRTNKVKRRH